MKKFIRKSNIKRKAEEILNGIKVGPSKDYNSFGDAKAFVPEGFYFNSNKEFSFNKFAPAGVIPTNAIIYSDGNNYHSLYIYDNDSNTFIAVTEPFVGYDEWRAQGMVDLFLNNAEKITEEKAKELIEKNKGIFEGTKQEILNYLEEANIEDKFRIQKI